MRVLVVDTETTGMHPSKGAGVVELGATLLDVSEPSEFPQILGYFQSLIDPGHVIPPEASAVHHLVDEDVRGQPDLESACARMLLELGQWDHTFAHNAVFDRAFLPKLQPHAWGCTLKGARKYVESPAYGNQVLRYHLRLNPVIPPEAGGLAHRALYDSVCTAWLLHHLLGRASIDDLLEVSGKPSLLKTCGFGKHRGTPWAQVPKDYLHWVLRQSGEKQFDADVVHTCKHWLKVD